MAHITVTHLQLDIDGLAQQLLGRDVGHVAQQEQRGFFQRADAGAVLHGIEAQVFFGQRGGQRERKGHEAVERLWSDRGQESGRIGARFMRSGACGRRANDANATREADTRHSRVPRHEPETWMPSWCSRWAGLRCGNWWAAKAAGGFSAKTGGRCPCKLGGGRSIPSMRA